MDCSDFIERKKNEALVNGLTKGKKHSLFGAIDALNRRARNYSNKKTTEQAINSIPFPTGPPYNPSSVTAYFAAMDSLLQTCGNSSGLVTLNSNDLQTYYQTIDNDTSIDSPFLLFCGTVFPSTIATGLDAEHFLIPSSYPIYIGGISYQTFGSGLSATLKVGASTIPLGGEYYIDGVRFEFLGGGSPGVNIKSPNQCYSDPLLDGGSVNEIQNIEIDGGAADNDAQLCSIDGEEI
jgi:hypothetical protein